MQWIVDSNDEVSITVGDFILTVASYNNTIRIYIICGAYARLFVGRKNPRDDVYFTPYGTLPSLSIYGEISINAHHSFTKVCYDNNVCTVISYLSCNGGRRWSRVGDLPIISEYVYRLIDY